MIRKTNRHSPLSTSPQDEKQVRRDLLRQQIKQDTQPETFSRTPLPQPPPGELEDDPDKTPEQEKQELWDNSFKNKPKGQAMAETSEGILIQNTQTFTQDPLEPRHSLLPHKFVQQVTVNPLDVILRSSSP